MEEKLLDIRFLTIVSVLPAPATFMTIFPASILDGKINCCMVIHDGFNCMWKRLTLLRNARQFESVQLMVES